jgi:hypothetical protein
MTPIHCRLDLLPLFTDSIVLICSFVCLVLYILERRFTVYLPTISETIVGWPNAAVFQLGAAIASTLFGFAVPLYSSSLDCLDLLTPALLICARVMAFLLPLLLILVANVTLEDDFTAHFVVALGLFGSFPILCFACWFWNRRWMPTALARERLVIAAVTIGIFLLLIVMSAAIPTVVGTSASASLEYLYIATMAVFFWSLRHELAKVQLHVVLTENV